MIFFFREVDGWGYTPRQGALPSPRRGTSHHNDCSRFRYQTQTISYAHVPYRRRSPLSLSLSLTPLQKLGRPQESPSLLNTFPAKSSSQQHLTNERNSLLSLVGSLARRKWASSIHHLQKKKKKLS